MSLTQGKSCRTHSKEGIAMRTLFTLGTLVAAVLVPWSSIAPSWLPDAAGSPVSESSVKRSIGPAARLNPALGILPLLLETPDEVRTVAGIADSHGPGALPPGVVCENGVCRIVDRPGSESSHRVVTSELKWDAVARGLRPTSAQKSPSGDF